MKAVRALDTESASAEKKSNPRFSPSAVTPHPERLSYIRYALRQGHTVKQLAKMTSIDPWFLYSSKKLMTATGAGKTSTWNRFRPTCCAKPSHGILRRTTGCNLASERQGRLGTKLPPTKKHD